MPSIEINNKEGVMMDGLELHPLQESLSGSQAEQK